MDRRRLLDVIDQACERLDAEVFAFCLMGNHYHFVLRTRQPNLSRLMRHVNGQYTQTFNRRHQVTGHVFQGRFHAVLVESDAYLLQACRYVELNPVRAGLVEEVDEWPWSSYRAHVGLAIRPRFLATAVVHGHLLRHDVTSADDRRRAQAMYAETVASGRGVDLWGQHLRQEIYLGSEEFASTMRARATERRLRCPDIAKSQRTAQRTLAHWLTPERTRNQAFRLAYSEGGMTMPEIATQAGMSVSSISRIITTAEQVMDSRPDPATFKT